jgi:hypothetical protein
LGAISDIRMFRLTKDGVQCGQEGFFVGSTPMLVRGPRVGGGRGWTARPIEELNRDLSVRYGTPIDIASKRDGLGRVARALDHSDLALAQITAVLLSFPDPPSLVKDGAAFCCFELAAQLFWSGLLKSEWDPAKHPRTGTPPNPGQFAATGGTPKPVTSRPGKVSPSIWQMARGYVRIAAEAVAERWSTLAWSTPILTAIDVALQILRPTEFNRGEQQLTDQLRASLDPPKTLDELRMPPTRDVLGYEQHHIVEQNDDNVAKAPDEYELDKFGRAKIDDPSNVVWVPRLKHELITAFYNSTDADDPQRRLHRAVVNAGDFDSQYQAGLAAL